MKCETISELLRFLSIQEQALGRQSPEVASTAQKLADLYMDKGMLDDAEKLYQRALEIRERAVGPHRQEAEVSRSCLEKLKSLRQTGADRESVFDASAPEMKEVQRHFEPSGDFPLVSSTNNDAIRDKTIDSSTSLDVISENFHSLNAQNLAEKVKELELEVDLIRQVSGSESLQLAECLTRLADLYCRTKLYDAMEPLLIESLKVREQQLGTDHYLVANSLKNLARLYYFQNKFALSKPLFEAAIAIRKCVFGPRHPKVADALTQFAKLLRKMNRVNEAKEIDAEVHSIRSKHGTWHRL